MKNEFYIALAGNPNVGKSTIFNNLTGMHQHTGNWAGKTVSNSIGSLSIKDLNFNLIDLPGTYSIMANSEEEEIARNYICFENPDITIIVVDSTCLERNLNLVFQIMEITNNIILCVNLLDEAKKKKIKIDLKKLEELLGIPVVGTSAKDKKTLAKLKETIYNLANNYIVCNPKEMHYSEDIEKNINFVSSSLIKNSNLDASLNSHTSEKIYKWIAIKILDGEKNILNSITKNFNINLNDNSVKKSVQLAKENLKNSKINNFKDTIIYEIMQKSEKISKEVCIFEDLDYKEKDKKIDKILTSKKFGIPIMIIFLILIFWLTIIGANYPSKILFRIFQHLQKYLINFNNFLHMPNYLSNMLIYGVYQTLTWIVSVMLPPMAIFFPLFTTLEDLGYLPRIAFNMDNFFKKAGCSGKQMITMCMGFGCNACGITGCRIIDSPREKLIAILTNNFVPCNGRFPFLITISSIFIGAIFTKYSNFLSSIFSTLFVIFVIILGIFISLLISKILSKTILKGFSSSLIMELPPYRKPQFGKILIRAIFDKILFILGRAICVAIPAGLVIWLFANISINNYTILQIIANFLEPLAKLMGLDGYILTAFILGIPANEIVLPIILMCYLKESSLTNIESLFEIKNILLSNNWTFLTSFNVMLFTIFHFPCSTTLLTIKKETNSLKWTFLAFALPTLCGIILCCFSTLLFNIFNFIF